MNVTKPDLFTRQFFFINGLFILVYSNIAFFFLYPLYLESLGGSKALIGWAMGALPASTVIVRPLMPALIRKIGIHKTLQAGLITIFIASLGYHMVEKLSWTLFAVRILHGLGFSAFVAASFTAVTYIIPGQRRAEAFGYIGAILLGCIAAAPILGEQLITGFGYPALFHSAAATAFFSMILVVTIRQKKNSADDPKNHTGILSVLYKKNLWLVLASTLIFVNANATLLTFVALFGKEQGFSGPVYYGKIAIIAILIRLFGAKLMDRHGKKRFAKYSFLLLGAGLILFTEAASDLFYYGSIILYGAGLGCLYPALNALAVDQADENERAAVMSLFTGVFDAGFMFGAVLSGTLADFFSLKTTFLVIGFSVFLGAFTITRSALKEKVFSA
ncbi:MAG: MFS transporter [Proteobacteria bacterium]|nr:MFS transporter [Pseudomonadota bacterium]MBU1709755.1 MFS transporter [Pseudomonadota bacterium]